MKLKLKVQRDGTLRPRWYGAWVTDGRYHETSLCRWRGKPPASFRVKDEGDKAFEDSRTRALAELREIVEGERSESDRNALAARVHRARYGQKVRRVKIADLYAAWKALPRKRRPTTGHEAVCKATFDRFARFMQETAPNVTETGALTAAHLRGFMEAEDRRGVSARTWNGTLSILRGTLARVDPNSSGYLEYLRDLPARDFATIHRRPFDEGELARIFDAAQSDPLLHGMIVAAACTAMRRGDIAKLRWQDVDLDAGFITVKTSKTGETVDCPIFPQLRRVLESLKRRGPFVFPEAAKIYATCPQTLDVRLRRVFEQAGFVRPPRTSEANAARHPAAPPEEIVRRTKDAMSGTGWGPKRQRAAMDILHRHLNGESGIEIAEALGISRGGVSSHLHAIENLIGLAVISPAREEKPMGPAMLAEIPPEIQRAKRGSLVGWHGFRVTFCTMALANGVPIELVQRITGHRTAEIVLKHYFRPNRKQLRDAIGERMPSALLGERETSKPESSLRDRLKKMDARNWKQIRAELLAEVGT
jgi:integrase